jgi:HEAT repeat protein
MHNRDNNEIVLTRSFLIFIGLSILLIVSGCFTPRRTGHPGAGFPPPPPPPSGIDLSRSPFPEREEPVPDPNLSQIESRIEMLSRFKFGNDNPGQNALGFFLDNIDNEEILAELRIVAEGGDSYQRMLASFVLFKAGDEQEKRVDVFIEAMETMMGNEILCAQYLTRHLLDIGDDPVFIGKFLELQSHPNPWNRATIVQIASKFPDAEGVREFLLNSLDDESWEVRSPAVIALGNALSNTSLYPNDPEIIERLYNLLDDDDLMVSSTARNVLGKFISIEETLELIDEIMKGETEYVPFDVHHLLINLGPSDEVNQFLVDRIDENNVSLTNSILGIIADRGENAASTVPALIELLNPQSSNGDFVVVLPRNETFLDNLFWALGCIGPAAVDAVPILGSMLRTDIDLKDWSHPEYYSTSQIIFALSSIGGPAVEYLPVIIDVARDSDGYLKTSAIDAIGRFGEQAESWAHELNQIAEELKLNRPLDYLQQPFNRAFIENSRPYCDAHYISRIHLALYRIGYEPDVQFDSLLAELEGPDFMFAVDVFEEMGAEAIEVLPKLRDMAEFYDEYMGLKNEIRNTINRIGWSVSETN